METSILNVRVDSNDKKNFEKFCSGAGMNVSTAVNMFIKTVIREQKLPFEIKSQDYDKYIYEKLKEAEFQIVETNKRYSHEEMLEKIDKIIND